MNEMPFKGRGVGALSPKTLAVALLIVTGIAGLLGGVALDRVVLLPPRGPRFDGELSRRRPPGPPFGLGFPGAAAPMVRELGLAPDQAERIDSIMQRHAAEFAALREQIRPQMERLAEQFRAEVDLILTPEQRVRFQARMRRGGGPPR